MLRTQLNIRPTTPREISVEDAEPIDADIEQSLTTICIPNHAAGTVVTAIAEEESHAVKQSDIGENEYEESGDLASGLEGTLTAELDGDFEVDVLEMIDEEADCDKSVDEELLGADEKSDDGEDVDEDQIEMQMLLVVNSLNMSRMKMISIQFVIFPE